MYFEIDPRAIALLDESISALLPDDYAVAADTPYGGAPGRPLTPEEIERLKGPKERTPRRTPALTPHRWQAVTGERLA